MPDLTPEKLAELRRAALIEGHDAAHYPTSVVVPTRTLLALLDAAGERDELAAKLAEVRALHQAYTCEMCREDPSCEACDSMTYPCATIRALGGEQ